MIQDLRIETPNLKISKKNHHLIQWLLLAVFTAVFAVIIAETPWWESFLKYLFPDQGSVLYPSVSLPALVIQHLKLVGISSALTVIIGVLLGIWVTRKGGRSFLPVVTGITSVAQTFPPVAVLAIAVPMLGFGLWSTVVALFLYGLLPVVHNTITGLQSVSGETLDAAYGIGMSHRQALFAVEIPLAAKIIMAGVRTSVVINVGTAMIGAVIGAGGLGAPIVAGLVQNNLAFVLEGAIPAALLAILLDQILAGVERMWEYK
jgi:osmoprotectant transport system permease protein